MNETREPKPRVRKRLLKAGKKWNGAKWCRPSTRFAIYYRDGFRCVWCGGAPREGAPTSRLSLDHLIPEELGGDHAPSNLVTACFSCNSARGAKNLRAWLKFLRDRGVDTSRMARRIRRLTKKPLDRKVGRELAEKAKRERA